LNVKNAVQLGNFQKSTNLWRQVEQLQLAARITDLGECSHKLSNTGAAYVGDFMQVQEDRLVSIGDKTVDRTPQRRGVFAEGDSPLHVENRYAINAAGIDFHRVALS
jgi:hypothetical protein